MNQISGGQTSIRDTYSPRFECEEILLQRPFEHDGSPPTARLKALGIEMKSVHFKQRFGYTNCETIVGIGFLPAIAGKCELDILTLKGAFD